MTFLEERDLENVPNIPEYYKGKTIFITGGSGFMGKVLVEKLLYSCTNLERIYLLLRSKKGIKPQERLEAIYNYHCFDRLRKEKPGVFESKVFMVAGDVAEIGLGISDSDRTTIVNKTHIIFHVAASVRFDDPLKLAVNINLRGTMELVNLAKEMQNLECFVHVSTSYSNTNRNPITEIIYPPHADWQDTLRVCNEVDEHTLNVLTPKYMGDLPNTYIFSKQLAEHLVYEYKGKLPIVIIRPSVVVSSHTEPIPGWIENFNGPIGMIVACGKGIIRTIYAKTEVILDCVPADFCIKGFIAAAWIRGTKILEPTDDVVVYNSCIGRMFPVSFGKMIAYGKQISSENPLKNCLWTYGPLITRTYFIYHLQVLLFHILPALFVDLFLWILGRRPILVKIQRRVFLGNLALKNFSTQQWTFCNKNFICLRSKIKEIDRPQFYYEMEALNNYEYFKTCCIMGIRFLLNQKEEDLPAAKVHYRRMQLLDTLVKCIFYGFLFWWTLNSSIFRSIISLESMSTCLI